MFKIKIFSTKKLSSPENLILSNTDFELIQEDFIQIKLLKFDISCLSADLDIDMLLFTSKNAVKSVLVNEKVEKLKKIDCVCVGEKTKELLIQNGFKVVDYEHYAEDLTPIIAQKYLDKSFAFFCGNLRRDVLPDFFTKNKVRFREIQVYENKFSSKKTTIKTDAILFFSPSGVGSFLEKNTISSEICFCIGSTTADALRSYTDNIILSEKPTIASVLEKVKEYFSKNKFLQKA